MGSSSGLCTKLLPESVGSSRIQVDTVACCRSKREQAEVQIARQHGAVRTRGPHQDAVAVRWDIASLGVLLTRNEGAEGSLRLVLRYVVESQVRRALVHLPVASDLRPVFELTCRNKQVLIVRILQSTLLNVLLMHVIEIHPRVLTEVT